jgi:hypothetical protein
VPRPLGERPLHLRHLGEGVLVTRPHVRQVGHPPSVACAAAPGNSNRRYFEDEPFSEPRRGRSVLRVPPSPSRREIS